ncbi:hypothetical protein DL770_007420 [Monosporascus sp. CRB-9-2]|nr:hypothetical protein DL770_007420 [Monosporascus sp. CRB-9-2]
MSNNRLGEDRALSPDVEAEQPQGSQNYATHPDAPINSPARLDYDEDDSSSLDDPSLPTPRFMQDEGAWKRWRWVPPSIRRVGRAVISWTRGPQNPRVWKIDPVFPRVQHAPLRLMDKFLPRKRHRVYLYMIYVSLWVVIFAIVMWRGQAATEIPVWGKPSSVSCTSTHWSQNNACGLDGMNCRPFNGSGFAFRCPADCAGVQVLNPRAVGAQEIVYRPLVIGGPPDPASDRNPVYRGDSFICGAAIHAGIVSNQHGGCGVLELVGTEQEYVSSTRNGIESIGFDSYFPKSFTFDQDIECRAKDVRWSLLALTVVFTVFLALFTASPGVFFFSTFIAVFWEVGMASAPPNYSTIPSLFSDIVGKFLPAMFCAWVFYDKMGVRRTLDGLTAQFEKAVLWLGGCWVGALSNRTFGFIPIQRLTGHDLEQQPGAKAALAIIVIILVAIFALQVWFFQQEGRLIPFLKLYLLFIVGIVVCLLLPNLNLRLHHYVIALLLLPGTAVQTRPSLLYQGVLVGLFVNGIARWGFDPMLQTTVALRGDGQVGSPLPVLLPSVINATFPPSIAFRWEPPPSPQYDGISVLVNDVERFRGFFGDEGSSDQFAWTRGNDNGNSSGSALDEYFRFAFMDGTVAYDYTKAGIWNADLEWIEPEPGPSKIRRRDGVEDDDIHRVSKALLHRRVS